MSLMNQQEGLIIPESFRIASFDDLGSMVKTLMNTFQKSAFLMVKTMKRENYLTGVLVVLYYATKVQV